jgi:protein-disulfide isomerase
MTVTMRMLTPAPVLLAALLASLVTVGCDNKATKKSPAATSSSEPAADTVVATYGSGQKVTWGELNEKIKDQLSELDQQKYQLRKQTLDGVINEKLVEAEATKRGVTAQELLKKEVEDKVTAPSEEEMRKLYDQAQAQGQIPPGASYDQLKPRIQQFLSGPALENRRREFFTQLREGSKVNVSLPAPARDRKEVAATGPARGPENAKVTIVEFSDFQCPFCSRAIKTVDDVVKQYDGKVRLVFRQFPLDFHQQAAKAAEASLCAGDQGKFWEYHDKLFANQQALQVEDLKKYAGELSLDAAKFGECLDSGTKAAQVSADLEAGKKVGVNGTPAFFINGVMISGAQPIEEFKAIIDEELKGKM